MAKQVIGIGASANDNTGDPLRTAFDKCNDNFTELYDKLEYFDDATTTALSLSALNASYPSVEVGVKVYALDVIAGALVYEKTIGGWISTPVIVVT